MSKQLACVKSKWNGREAYTLHNGLVQLVTLTGGGHIAEFQFRPATKWPAINPLWVPPWKSMEPYLYQAEKHSAEYGPVNEGKLLSGIAGHNICLDYFGPPSEEEAAQGLSTHGEAPSARWEKTRLHQSARRVSLTLEVDLPVAGLHFIREIRLHHDECVAYFHETVVNESKADHFFHWTQHVTLGPPFLGHETSRVDLPGTRAKTHPGGYGGKELLESGRSFYWPSAPAQGGGSVDLASPFSKPGLGFLVSVLLNPRQEVEYVSALNATYGLLFGYIFRRLDFPWVAIWEENQSRSGPPWNSNCQARGLEFGSTPSPVPRREAFAVAPSLDTPTFSIVPAKGKVTANYLAFLTLVPPRFDMLKDVQIGKNEIYLHGHGHQTSVRLPATGLPDLEWPVK